MRRFTSLSADQSRLRRLIGHWIVAVTVMSVTAALLIGGVPRLTPSTQSAPLARASRPVGTSPVAATETATRDRPVAVRIPSIDVDAPIVDLGLADDGTLEVPEGRQDAGWWAGGAAPGQVGPAVIVGHVNLRSGPAVFLRLHELEPGDVIEVDAEDGSQVRYVVRTVEQVDKDRFPTRRVYGDTAAPELRLITCGGSFRRSDRSYQDNVIVYADLISESEQLASPTSRA